MIVSEEEYLAHYGTPRHSGRYPWGSGGNTTQRNQTFLQTIDSLKSQGLSDTEIYQGMGITSNQYRAMKSIAKNEARANNIATVEKLHAKGMSNVAIGKQMGINESQVRALLAPGVKERTDILQSTSNMLRDQVNSKDAIDIGAGVEIHLGISKERLATAVAVLEDEGYKVHQVQVTQLGTGKQTTIRVLAKEEVVWSEMMRDPSKIRQIQEFSDDNGRTFSAIKPPLNVDQSRIQVKYAEQGGKDADGVIYVRPGVDDLSLGQSRYAQVRVAVDGTHYLKGMAVYNDNLPKGVDLQFNTNKSDTGNKLDAMKKQSDDPTSPFGSIVTQIGNRDDAGRLVKVTSAMNLVNEEGKWDDWSRNLSSQFLSKQSPQLAKNQLAVTYENKRADLDDILKLTNPAVKKKLLESFADDVDASAVHLKAANLPRQRTQVILPIDSLKPTEVYAPNFRSGERVVLIRYPHGGTFEIPELVVNNNHPQSKKSLGDAIDAIGINSKVAERLSGADFDGDTVLVIPNNGNRVKTSSALKTLNGFDPQALYKLPDSTPKMKPQTKGKEMGLVSNLITDMTIRGANTDELARAVRHSMVVIDAEKHHLNYKQSAIDHGIGALIKKYQPEAKSAQGGASTLLSQRKSRLDVPDRRARRAKDGGPIDAATGKKMYRETGESYVNAKGKTIYKTVRTTKLADTDDAHTLSSGTAIEKVYADHSNRLKALANQARKEMVATPNVRVNPSAKQVYAPEVKRLNAALNVALKNAPRERNAQIIANAIVRTKRDANPNMDAPELKKVKAVALAEARLRAHAGKERITISPREWDAIQAGALSQAKLVQILNNTDDEVVKQLATPKSKKLMTSTKLSRANAMLASGYTQAEVADALGVSLTTLKNEL